MSSRLARAFAAAELAEWSFDPHDDRWLIAFGLEDVYGEGIPVDARAANAALTAAGEHADPAAPRSPLARSVFGDCLNPDDVGPLEQAYGRLLDVGESMRVEARIRRTDGQPRWILIDGEAIERAEDGPVRLSGLVRDITEIKQLRAEKGFLADLAVPLAHLDDYDDTLQRVADAVVPFLADRCILEFVLADGTLERVADSLHPAPISPSLAPEHSAERVRDAPLVDRIVHGRRTLALPDLDDDKIRGLSATEEHYRELQAFKPCDYIGVPLEFDGRCFGVLGILTRQDGRRFLTQELELVERVGERIASALENARLYATLREADRRKTHFLAVLSHELRNPLAAITAGLDAVRDSLASPGERDTLAMIDRQAAGLARLMDDLLDVARVDADKVHLNVEWVSISRAVDDAMAGVAPTARARRQRLSSRLPEPDVSVRADRVRLEQILVNLLVNASRYTPDGGSLSIEARLEEARVVIDVSDTGVGLTEEERRRIFDRFEQVHDMHSPHGDGLGLGLSLVSALVALHEGTITVDSPGKGMGSRFRLTLPHVRRETAGGTVTPARESAGPRRGAPLRVLVIDDNEDASVAITSVLDRLGHDVRRAGTGEEGLSAYRTEPAALVVLDIGLPDLDGYAVAERLREHERASGLPPCHLVALTGYGQAEDRRRALESGFDEHRVKPLRLKGLRTLLDTAAARHVGHPG